MSSVNMDEKVTLVNLAPWEVAFNKLESVGHVIIPPKGKVRVTTRSEVMAQVSNNNNLIGGIDELGSHATVYIDDAETRKMLEFDTDSKKQMILTKDVVAKIFELKTFSTFKKRIEEYVVTRCEKRNLMDYIKELGINEYDKIVFCQEHCKFDFL